jgi:Fic family protein
MRLVGRYEGLLSPRPQPKLRRHNRIRTIRGSLAIEGNTLTESQITAVIEKKRVIGPKREIREVQNAVDVYDTAASLNPTRQADLLRAHGRLMKGLVEDAGKFRSSAVGILRGTRVAHVAPPANRVPRLVADVLAFLKKDLDTHPLVKSAVVHYELEFIHPFSDGNGRMGRLWQHVVLLHYHPVFDYLPIESVIHAKQAEYYRVLAACDQAGNSTRFIEFSLRTIQQALQDFLGELRPEPATSSSRLEAARTHFGKTPFTRKDYLSLHKNISTATASRDLKQATQQRSLTTQGSHSQTTYRFRPT